MSRSPITIGYSKELGHHLVLAPDEVADVAAALRAGNIPFHEGDPGST